MFKNHVVINELGVPFRSTVKVVAWNFSCEVGVVVQLDKPNRDNGAFVWLP